MELDRIKIGLGVMSAMVALAGGSYQAAETFGWIDNPILEWSPENFSISSGPVNGEFSVVVARQKLRDDCSVEDFKLEVRDSQYFVHPAVSSIAKFSGAASDKVDKFGYRITIQQGHRHKVALGEATLLAHIKYKCPEGDVVVNYPDHNNLRFNITKENNAS